MKKAFQRKQIVKENVKAVLSENKQVISVSFIALFQTLKVIQKWLILFTQYHLLM